MTAQFSPPIPSAASLWAALSASIDDQALAEVWSAQGLGDTPGNAWFRAGQQLLGSGEGALPPAIRAQAALRLITAPKPLGGSCPIQWWRAALDGCSSKAPPGARDKKHLVLTALWSHMPINERGLAAAQAAHAKQEVWLQGHAAEIAQSPRAFIASQTLALHPKGVMSAARQKAHTTLFTHLLPVCENAALCQISDWAVAQMLTGSTHKDRAENLWAQIVDHLVASSASASSTTTADPEDTAQVGGALSAYADASFGGEESSYADAKASSKPSMPASSTPSTSGVANARAAAVTNRILLTIIQRCRKHGVDAITPPGLPLVPSLAASIPLLAEAIGEGQGAANTILKANLSMSLKIGRQYQVWEPWTFLCTALSADLCAQALSDETPTALPQFDHHALEWLLSTHTPAHQHHPVRQAFAKFLTQNPTGPWMDPVWQAWAQHQIISTALDNTPAVHSAKTAHRM